MKKTSLALVPIAFLFFLPVSGMAKEESPSPPVAVQSFPREPVGTTLPFEYSLGQGQWVEARPGPIFTSGTYTADLILPSLKEAPAPIRYPRWAVREGWEGKFVIAVEVLPTGAVGRWKIMESTGYPLLDEAATEAVRQWSFHPATEQGKPVVSCIQIPIHFELQG